MLRSLILVTAFFCLTACKDKAEIRYTAFNVPHITATSYYGLGYGSGYAQAEENLCTLTEQIVKLKGQKSRYFGPGQQQVNLLSDFGYKILDYPGQAHSYLSQLPAEASELLHGFVSGFNARLTELTPETYPSPCRQANWVAPLSATELLAYHLELAGLASSRNLLLPMALAQPPVPGNQQQTKVQLNAEHILTSRGLGSNGWALGGDKTTNGQGALLANPHFPWDGELRFFQQHLTIPGKLDVSGVTLVGLPTVLIGFNPHLAWTHTISQSKQFTFYQLELEPDNPLRYRYGNEYRDFTQQQVSIDVMLPDGSMQQVSRTFYRSHYGPLLDLSTLDASLGWTTQSAISYRDANAGNYRMLQQWLAIGQARNKTELMDALAQHQGIPWVNTLVTEQTGDVHYIDASQVPLLHPVAEAYWRQASQSPALAALWLGGDGAVLLPGSEPIFEWQDSGQTLGAGLVPLQQAPQLSRRDYLFNANSSHWLANPQQPLEGYSLMYGPERTELSPRSRYNGQLINNPQLMGADLRFSAAELRQVFNRNESLFSDSFRQQLVQHCQANPVYTDNTTEQTVDLQLICQALANWDGRYNLNSRGAHIMREFLAAFRSPAHAALQPQLFAMPFDANAPLHTPDGLAISDNPQQDPVLQALGQAALRLQQAGIAPDATLASIQYLIKAEGQTPIAMPGGYSFEGLFNMAEGSQQSRSSSELANNVTGIGRPDSPLLLHLLAGEPREAYTLNSGSSFVMVMAFTEQGPQASMLHAYSQAHDPQSVHFNDQTLLYREQAWQPMYFQQEDIKQHTKRLIRFSLPRPE
ncbi:penicillin acylase family protein [Rheinheimera nanhaiensis]|uniref:Acyl-homoserine-lactone acylase n=1 Tax=Rheinheimera nanhaiensis E407-8 TaxID=562729 RepID=I1DZR2_9GAMM|nr:penicillin acylase family protein [Rheinheimera nanhaiensis]GAB59540.1 acyl-homoserine-lactone acylase [Rheinheimera nanhaiensis E407-8]